MPPQPPAPLLPALAALAALTAAAEAPPSAPLRPAAALSWPWPFGARGGAAPATATPPAAASSPLRPPGTLVLWGPRLSKSPPVSPAFLPPSSITAAAVADAVAAAVDDSGTLHVWRTTESGRGGMRRGAAAVPGLGGVVDVAVRWVDGAVFAVTRDGGVYRVPPPPSLEGGADTAANARVTDGDTESGSAAIAAANAAAPLRRPERLGGAAAATPVVAVDCGERHCVAVTAFGGLLGWGDDTAGALSGHPRVPRPVTPTGAVLAAAVPPAGAGTIPDKAPVALAPPSAAGPVVAASAGGGHSLAAHGDGGVSAAGWDDWGQLGVTATPWVATTTTAGSGDTAASGGGDSAGSGWVRSPPGGVGADGNAAPPASAVAAGGAHSLAVHPDGTASSWGSGAAGATAQANAAGVSPRRRVVSPGGGDVHGVAAGRSHSVVLAGGRVTTTASGRGGGGVLRAVGGVRAAAAAVAAKGGDGGGGGEVGGVGRIGKEDAGPGVTLEVLGVLAGGNMSGAIVRVTEGAGEGSEERATEGVGRNVGGSAAVGG